MRVRTLSLVLAVAIPTVVVLAVPALRWGVWGWLRGELFADGRPVSYWVNELEYGDTEERERAAISLGHIKGPYVDMSTAAAILGWKSQNDPSVEVRRLATESLGRMAPTGYPVTGRLVDACADKDHTVRLAAVRGLAQVPLPDDRVFDTLGKLAEKDVHAEVRERAAASLQAARANKKGP